jgi:secondary thiamine-phosphate synthase enzyme
VRREEFEVGTTGSVVTEITDRVAAFVREAAAGRDGLVHVFVPHATCGLALIEAAAGSEPDLEDAIERLLPRDDRYRHRHGSVGHGADHLLPALVSPALSLPVDGGGLVLGTWQRIVIVDPNRENNRRRVQLRFLTGS